jgi:hypothetical protein
MEAVAALALIIGAIVIFGTIFFIIEVMQYRRFMEAVETFNIASEAYSGALREAQVAVNAQADSLIAMGEALSKHDTSLGQHEIILNTLNISIAALHNLAGLMFNYQGLDTEIDDVVQSEASVPEWG